MSSLLEWARWFWFLAHCRLLDEIEEREDMARIRWAKAQYEADRDQEPRDY